MAEEKAEQKTQQATPESATPPASEKAAAKTQSSILSYVIVAVIVLICAGAGVGLGLLFAGGGKVASEPVELALNEEQAQSEEPKKAEHSEKDKKPETQKSGKPGEVWYYDLDPVVANLNEPGATRYVRAVLTLEMSPTIAPDKGTALLSQKKPLLTNLMTIYLAGLSVDETRGDKNLKRIQADLTDTFNEKLFPDGTPLIKGILIKEFAVQ